MKKEINPKKKNPREIKAWAIVCKNQIMADDSLCIYRKKGLAENHLCKDEKVRPCFIKIID